MNRKSIYLKLLSVLLCTSLLYSCKSQSTSTSTPTATTTSTSTNANIITPISKVVTYDANDYYTEWKNETPNYITLNGTGATLNGTGATVKDSKITIVAAGVYVISGKLNNGQIIVDVKDKGTVKIVLNGAEINCDSNSPIYVASSGKTIISLQEGTENIITDGTKYVLAEASSDEPNAAIYSKDDLTINGTGKLTVDANYKDGITSKDDLKITGGNINIHSADDGLMGKDIVAVKEGIIAIEAGGDGIKASNDTEELKGYVAIEGGSFNIKSEADGIQAYAAVLINDGAFTITSGGGSAKAIAKTYGTERVSAKGIKASEEVSIARGTFKIDSADDALHSSKYLTISSGDFAITTGDDGAHADESLLIKDGKINISKSYEGMESKVITLSGGEIHVTASDDGINAGSGTTEETATKATPGESSGTSKLNINGGYITVDASGDGLDANGSIYMTSGTVIVSGPTNNGNGALDYDGVFEISGGLLMSAGSSGMAQATSAESSQHSIIMNYTEAQKAGTIVHLQDNKGNTIGTFTPHKDYQSVVISSSKLAKDGTYTLYSGGTTTASETASSYTDGEYKAGTKVVELTIADSVTWLNETGVTTAKTSNMGGPGGQGNKGFGRQQRDPAAMKTAYSTILNALVADKTITQEQADKVLVAATENIGVGGMKPQDKAPADGTRPKNDSLSGLVTSKVITQAQADTINHKFQESRH